MGMAGLGPGSELGHYRILRSLGSGGMADVYEAEDTRLGRHVALKILPPEFARNPQLIARFEKEVRAAASLNHRNIVTVFEVGEQGGLHYFSMRLLTGGDLRRRIEHGLTPVESLAILRELADAFSHAHTRGFVHRDVKPENVMFDEQGFPVLTDFGIAKALDTETRMTRTGMTMGTPRYLSPEQASGKPVDARADLYSLGVIFYEMLTGHPPYDAEESMAVIFKHVTEPVPHLPGELIRLQPLLERLMAKDPAQRVGSAEELIRAIDAIAPKAAGPTPPPSQVRTQENPLIAHLLTPSPLRTAPPVTPRPVTPRPVTPAPREDSGEVAVRPAPVAAQRSARAAQTDTAAAPAAAPVMAAPAVAAPSRAPLVVAASVAVAVAAVGLAAWAYRHDLAALLKPAPVEMPAQAPVVAPPAPVVSPTAPAATPADDAAARRARAEELKVEQARQARLRQEAEARKKAEADAAVKRQREQARQDQLKREQDAAQRRAAAEAEAKKRAEAEAEARRRAEAEAAEKRRLEQAAREKQRQEAEAKKKAEAEAARKKKEEEKAKAASPADEQKKAEEEEKARERARRPAGF